MRNRWRLGLAAAALLDWIAWGLIALAGLCLADLLLSLESGWRSAGRRGGLGGVTLVAAIRVVRILTFGLRAAAEVADGLLASRRREALTAHTNCSGRDRARRVRRWRSIFWRPAPAWPPTGCARSGLRSPPRSGARRGGGWRSCWHWSRVAVSREPRARRRC